MSFSRQTQQEYGNLNYITVAGTLEELTIWHDLLQRLESIGEIKIEDCPLEYFADEADLRIRVAHYQIKVPRRKSEN